MFILATEEKSDPEHWGPGVEAEVRVEDWKRRLAGRWFQHLLGSCGVSSVLYVHLI